MQKDRFKAQENALVEVKALEKAVLRLEVIKAPNLAQDIQEKLVLKGVKCHFKDEYQNLALTTLTEKITKVSIWTPSKIWWIQKKLNQSQKI